MSMNRFQSFQQSLNLVIRLFLCFLPAFNNFKFGRYGWNQFSRAQSYILIDVNKSDLKQPAY